MDSARNSFASSRLSSGTDVDGGLTYSEQLLKILSERRGIGVSDPRDMIFGHLGILGNGTPP
jgi:hypothetical protein